MKKCSTYLSGKCNHIHVVLGEEGIPSFLDRVTDELVWKINRILPRRTGKSPQGKGRACAKQAYVHGTTGSLVPEKWQGGGMEQWAKSLEEPRHWVSSFAMTLSKCWRQSTRRQASTDSTSDAGVTNQSSDIFWTVGDRALTVVPHIYLREGPMPLLWLAPDLPLLSLSPLSWPFHIHIHMHVPQLSP